MGFRNRTAGYELAANEVVTPASVAFSLSVAQDDTQLVAAVANRRIRVYALQGAFGGASSTSLNHVIFRSIGSATSAISGSMFFGQGAKVWPYNPNGWMQTDVGDGLFFSSGGAPLGGGSILAACVPG